MSAIPVPMKELAEVTQRSLLCWYYSILNGMIHQITVQEKLKVFTDGGCVLLGIIKHYLEDSFKRYSGGH